MKSHDVFRFLAGLVLATGTISGFAQSSDAKKDSDDPRGSMLGLHIGPFRVLPTAGLSFGYESNVALQDRNAKSANFSRFSPGVRLETGGERNLLSFTYTGEYQRYSGSSQDNYRDSRFGVDWFYNPVLRHAFALDASVRYSHDQRGSAAREGDLALLNLDADRYRTTELGGKYRFGTELSRGQLELEASTGSRTYLNNRIYTRFRDYDTDKIGAGFNFRLAPHTSAVLKIDQTRYNYDFDFLDANGSLDNRERHYYVGVRWDATARTTGTVLFGRVRKSFDDPTREDFSGSSWKVGVQWRPRTYSTIDFTANRETDETNGVGDFILRRDYTAGWSHEWNDRFRTTLDGGFGTERHEPTPRVDDLRFWGVSAAYELQSHLRVGAGYHSYNRDSNVDNLNYDRSLWLLSLEGSL